MQSTESDRGNALGLLDKKYGLFINQNDWSFFRGLADYVRTVRTLAPTKEMAEVLERQRETARKAYELMSSQAVDEFTKSAAVVLKAAETLASQTAPIMRSVEEARAQIAGNLSTSNPLGFMDSNLHEIATHLKAVGFAESVKQFEDDAKAIKNIYGNYTFSPTYEKMAIEEKRLERQEEAEAWGAWHELPIVEIAIFEPEKLNEEARKDLRQHPNLKAHVVENYEDLRVQEMDRIRDGRISADKAVFFKIKKYKDYTNRVHIYLAGELAKPVVSGELKFDEIQSLLTLTGRDFKISKRAESDPHELLRTIFKNRSKTWENDEVLEDWKITHDKKRIPKNKVYQAGVAVNRIVAQHTGIDDFLVVTTKNVAINKAYLET